MREVDLRWRRLARRLRGPDVAELLRDDPDLGPLQGNERFEGLVELSAQRAAEARAAARERMLLYPPKTAVRATVLALHGASWRSAKQFAKFWQPLTKSGVLLAVPQSRQPSSDEGFGGADADDAAAQVTGHLAELRRQRPTTTPIILAGFSQGAGLTLRWALSGQPLRPDGFIAVNPAITDAAALVSLAQQASGNPPPGVIFAGDRDPRNEKVAQLAKELRDGGVACRLEILPDTGHWFSADFADRVTAALTMLLSQSGTRRASD
jgi:predicted esterase